MSTVRLKPSLRGTNPVTILDTALNSFADGTGVLSGVISNDATTDELDLWADLELYIAGFGTAPDDNSAVDVYVVRTVDGTNYEDNATDGRPMNGWVGAFIVDNAKGTGAQRLVVPQVPLPPRDFKIYLISNTGQTMNATANTLKAYFYSMQNS